MTVTFLSFLAEAVFRHGVYHLILNTLLNGPSTASSLTSSSSSRASNLLHRGTWGSEMDRDEVCLQCQAGICFHSSLSLEPPTSAQKWQARGSTTAWGVSPWCLSCKFGRKIFHQSVFCKNLLCCLVSPHPP